MRKNKNINFEAELSKMMPALLREITKQQEAVCAKGNLAISHIVILDLLQERGPCRMSELAQSLKLTMSAVTGIIDKMVEVGLVKREHSKEDRRVVKVSLIKEGVDVARHINEGRRKIIDNIYSVLTYKEKKVYLAILRKAYRGLRKD